MSDKDTTYNGWRNYETWAVALWIDNEQETQEQALEMARNAVDAAGMAEGEPYPPEPRHILADTLKTWVSDELLPDLGATLAADLLGAAVSEVDWREIAEHYLADLPAQESEEAEA